MTRRILKNFLSFILMAAMLLSMVPAVTITASAASSGEVTGLTNDNVGLSFSGDKEDTWSANGTTVTGSIQSSSGCGTTHYSSTLTLTNKRSIPAVLSFDYAIDQQGGTIQVDGTAVTAGGTFSKEIAAGGTVNVYIKSNSTSAPTKVTLTNIALSANVEATVTFLPAENGSYNVNGTPVTEEYSHTQNAVNAYKLAANHVAAVFVVYSVILGLCYHDLAHVTIFSKTYIFLLVLSIGLATLAKYVGGLANLTLIVADKKAYVNNLIMVGTTMINTAAVAILVRMGAGLVFVKLGSSLIFVVRPVLYAVYVKKHYILTRSSKKTALDQKWTGIGQHIAYFLHKNTDIVLLTLLADLRLVAVYSVHNMVINSIRSITEALSGGMEAVFGECIAKDDKSALQKTYRKYKTLLSAGTLVLFSCAGILIVPFIRLYTKGITDVNYIQPAFAWVFLLAEAVNCLVLPCSSLPVAADHLKQTRWGAYSEALINIILSCILIKWEPLLGVAIGTLVATVFRAIYYMAYSAKNILRLPIHRILLTFFVTILLLFAVTLCGVLMIRTVVIKNFISWTLCGGLCFLIIALPAAFAARKICSK